MKRAYIAGIFMVVLLAFCFFTSRQVCNVSLQLVSQISTLEADVRQQPDAEVTRQHLTALEESWNQHRSFFMSIIGRTTCEPIESIVSEAPIWYEQKHYTQLLASLSRLTSQMEDICETQALHWDNLF